MAWVEISCEIVCTLTCRELSKPETLGIKWLQSSLAGYGAMYGWPRLWGKERHKRNAQSSFPGPFSCLCSEMNHPPSSIGERKIEAVGKGSIFVTCNWVINSASKKVNIKDRLSCYFHCKYKCIKKNSEKGKNMKRSHFLTHFKTANETEPSVRS